MQLSAAKLTLIVIGSAIGGIVVFVVGMSLLAYYVFPRGTTLTVGEKHTDTAPAVRDAERYLGAHGHSNGPIPINAQVLDAGASQLVGTITSAGAPLQGLRVRLLLNAAVYSQWATSGSDGRYVVSIPPGEYKIDGFQLDSESADRVLKGKIENPRNVVWGAPMKVASDNPGKAPVLDFIDPVRKTAPLGEVKAKQIIITWNAYPNAARYRIQMTEQKQPQGYEGQKQLFDWNNTPKISATSFNPADAGVELKKGMYYSTSVEALDADNRVLSTTARSYEADFLVIE